MNKSIVVILATVFSFLSIPMLANADKDPPGGTPHVLGAIQEQVTEINGKIDDLDSDDDNPLLADILAEIQGMRGDMASMHMGAVLHGVEQSEGLLTNPAEGSVNDLVTLTGGGTFVAARMTKQGGTTNITSVELIIDGKTVVGRNFAALDNWGMTQSNPFGVVLLHGNGVDAVTIGFPQPIKFNDSLVLRTHVGESGVVQMIGTVVHGL